VIASAGADRSRGTSVAARGLTRRFGDLVAVDAIDFDVSGEVLFVVDETLDSVATGEADDGAFAVLPGPAVEVGRHAECRWCLSSDWL
jgi:hypothetical protein